jgi:multiple sugar transport system substrate-binding protein
MKRKYGILVIILLFLISGLVVGLINRFYSFEYLYNLLIKREFAINPKVEVVPEKRYQVRIWYYPFFRTINNRDEKEFFREVLRDLQDYYPNISIKVRELSFLDGYEELLKAIEEETPPDIYLNFTPDSLINPEWQIAVDPYVSALEKEGFYTVEWEKINASNHLWGWPFLIQEQSWISNEELSIDGRKNFLDEITQLRKETLLFNYADLTLLRQLLTLNGLDKIIIRDNQLLPDTKIKLREVFNIAHNMRKNQHFACPSTEMEGNFLKLLFEKKPIVAGPVNPYLEYFLMKKERGFYRIPVEDLVQVYTLSVFRQRNYKGDDHSRAVMEVARLMSERQAVNLAEEIGLKPAYRNGVTAIESANDTLTAVKKILEIYPEEREYWEEVITRAWLDFWEKGLTPEEVMSRFE